MFTKEQLARKLAMQMGVSDMVDNEEIEKIIITMREFITLYGIGGLKCGDLFVFNSGYLAGYSEALTDIELEKDLSKGKTEQEVNEIVFNIMDATSTQYRLKTSILKDMVDEFIGLDDDITNNNIQNYVYDYESNNEGFSILELLQKTKEDMGGEVLEFLNDYIFTMQFYGYIDKNGIYARTESEDIVFTASELEDYMSTYNLADSIIGYIDGQLQGLSRDSQLDWLKENYEEFEDYMREYGINEDNFSLLDTINQAMYKQLERQVINKLNKLSDYIGIQFIF